MDSVEHAKVRATTGTVGFFPVAYGLVYMFSSTFLSLWNKFVLTQFPLASFYLTATFTLTFVFGTVLLFTCYKSRLEDSPVWPGRVRLSDYVFKLAPVGLLFGADVVFTTWGIMNGSVPFVEMIKCGIPTVILIVDLITGNHEHINLMCCLCVLSLTCGHILLYITDATFNMTCFICSVLALLCAALKLSFTERMTRNGFDVSHNTATANNPSTIQGSNASSTNTNCGYHSLSQEALDQFLPPLPTLKEITANVDKDMDLNLNEEYGQGIFNNVLGGYLSFDDEDLATVTTDGDDLISATAVSTDLVSDARTAKLHPLLAIFYFMPLCIACAVVLCLADDLQSLEGAKIWHDSEKLTKFALYTLLGGIAAFAINMAEIAVLATSSALVFTVVIGGTKMMVMLFLSWLFFNNSITRDNLPGYLLCAFSIVAYNSFRAIEAAKRRKQVTIPNKGEAVDDLNFQSEALLRASFQPS